MLPTKDGKTNSEYSEAVGTNTDAKIVDTNPKDITAWNCDMASNTQKCVERYCEQAQKTIDQLRKVSTLCSDDHQVKPEDLEIVGVLSEICSQIVSNTGIWQELEDHIYFGQSMICS